MSSARWLIERAVPRWAALADVAWRRAALADAARRGPTSMLARRDDSSRAGTRRVKLTCGSCGRVAAIIEEHPAGTSFADYPGLFVLVRSGHVTRRHLQQVTCPRHGLLRASWTRVLPAAEAARDGRVRTLRLWPVTAAPSPTRRPAAP
jgi:hypothetical protein